MNLVKYVGILGSRTRRDLASEGLPLRKRIENQGIPRMWGAVPPDVLADVKSWQQKCARAGLSQAPVYTRLSDDPRHVTGPEVLLIIDEIMVALDPPGSMGG
ncbi:MAG: hypothetical protein LC772_01895 [Chloroflexi bacterium]|nr:hypothetical protein [Chloroflexota bacterium]